MRQSLEDISEYRTFNMSLEQTGTVNDEWTYMDSIPLQQYYCLRRPDCSADDLVLDGSLDKPMWRYAPWSEYFEDIQGPDREHSPAQRTRMKMLWDNNYLIVGVEMEETKLWGTLTKNNSTMYHENDIEVFLNPDGSHHNYYEFEMNCLNTIWELLLHKPYKDGHSIENPHNLRGTKSAVDLHGNTPNDPSKQTTKWSMEVAFPLDEMTQFHYRSRKVQSGDIWRVNFSRVEYDLEVVDGSYRKVPNRAERNWVWSPTGVIDMHRPEKWGNVLFCGREILDDPTRDIIDPDWKAKRVLNTVYYDQRKFIETHQCAAKSIKELYPNDERKEIMALVRDISFEMDVTDDVKYTISVQDQQHRTGPSNTLKWTITHDALLLPQ